MRSGSLRSSCEQHAKDADAVAYKRSVPSDRVARQRQSGGSLGSASCWLCIINTQVLQEQSGALHSCWSEWTALVWNARQAMAGPARSRADGNGARPYRTKPAFFESCLIGKIASISFLFKLIVVSSIVRVCSQSSLSRPSDALPHRSVCGKYKSF